MATDDRTDCLRGDYGFSGILFLVSTMNRFKDYSSVLHVDNLEDLLTEWDNPVKRLYKTPVEDMRKNAHDTPQIPTKRQIVKKGDNKHS